MKHKYKLENSPNLNAIINTTKGNRYRDQNYPFDIHYTSNFNNFNNNEDFNKYIIIEDDIDSRGVIRNKVIMSNHQKIFIRFTLLGYVPNIIYDYDFVCYYMCNNDSHSNMRHFFNRIAHLKFQDLNVHFKTNVQNITIIF